MRDRQQTAGSRQQEIFAPAACCLLSVILSTAVLADTLTVDRTSVMVDDTIMITVSLDGAFTSLDSVELPLTNLKIISGPSTSSEITWVNGTLTQRKSLRYLARPLAAGTSTVGPLTLESREGARETLPQLTIQVAQDLAAQTSDPASILRELLSTRRDPFFVVVEADRTKAFVGEQIVLTWTVYNAASVDQWDITNAPKLQNFWTEELGTPNEQAQQVTLGGLTAQKLVVKRLAVFPLQPGTLTIDPLEVAARIVRQIDLGTPFGAFEGSVVDISRHSAPLQIDVQPLPPGPAVDVVGDLALNCGKPVQANGGPITIDVALSGRANLRNAQPPQWEGVLRGSSQIEEGKVNVVRAADGATMTRHWKLLVFPAHEGMFMLPPLVAHAFSPANGRQDLRCEAKSLNVTAAQPGGVRTPRPHTVAETSALQPIAVSVLAIVICSLTMIPIRRTLSLRARVRAITRPREETRANLQAFLAARGVDEAALLRESTDRGDAYRAVISLLDAIDRERIEIEDVQKEIELRTRDFLQSWK